ncbi:MAG: hypothetical protein LUD48_06670, partial [Prevotella sp.]|nr:hypothetical protein [Prevotella sp.]
DAADTEYTWDNAQSAIEPLASALVSGITISVNGQSIALDLDLSNFSLSDIASYGTVSENTDADGHTCRIEGAYDEIISLIEDIWDIVTDNEEKVDTILENLLGADTWSTVETYVDKVFALSSDDVIDLIFELLESLDSSDFVADWSFLTDNYEKTSVSYKNGYKSSEVSNLVDTISAVLENVLTSILDVSLTDLTAENVYTDDMVTTIASAIYSLLDNSTVKTIMSLLGIDVSTEAVSALLSDYSSVAKSIAASDTFSAADTSSWKWGVTDRESFAAAIAAVISPFNDLLAVLLNSGTISIAGVADITGANGYSNAIKPLLDALGCTTVSASQYAKDISNDENAMISDILNSILDLVDSVLADPVNGILEIAPSIANFIDKGGVQYFVECLLYPVLNIVSPLTFLLTDSTDDTSIIQVVLDFLGVDLTWDEAQDEIIPYINSLLSSITINGTKVSITLPDMDLSKLGGCGTVKSGAVNANTTNAATLILKYLWNTVTANQTAINKIVKSLAGSSTYKTLKPYLAKIYAVSDDEFITILVELVAALDASDFTADWSFLTNNYKKTSVSYTNGYTSSEVSNLVDAISTILNNVLNNVLNLSLTDLVADNVYTDSMVTSIVSTVYSLFDNTTVKTILSLLGADVSQKTIAKELKAAGYTKVASSIKSASSLSSADTSKWKWNVTDRKTFAKALVAALSPLEDILNVFLNSGTISIAGVIDFTGANGYANAVKPLLDALGCTTVSTSKYAKDAKSDKDNLLLDIINPLLNLVDKVLKDPVNEIVDLLPSIANFIGKGGVQYFVECLLYPVTNFLDPLTFIILDDGETIYDMVVELLGINSTWDNLQNDAVSLINSSSLLKNIKIGSATVSFKLPSIKWSKIGGAGKVKSKLISANSTNSATLLLKYLWRVVTTNETAINKIVKSLAGSSTYKTLKPYLARLLAISENKAVATLCQLVEALDSSSYSADWSFLTKNYKSTSVTYPSGVTESDILETIDILTEAVTNALEIFSVSLPNLVSSNVYTDSVVTSIVKAVYSLFDNSTVKGILSLFGIDVSQSAVAKSLKSDYPSVASSIKSAKSYSKADTSKWKWNVTDRKTFAKALVAALRPFEDVLAVFLNSGTVNIADVVDFTGANGYKNAVKPMLDALGCTTVSASQYAKDVKSNKDNLLLDIINPLLNLVDSVLKDPINKALEIMPSIANFINKGGVQCAIENLLYPITNFLNPITSIILDKGESVYDFLLELLGVDATWDNLQNDLVSLINSTSLLKNITIGSSKVSFKIPSIDWSKLAGCGKVSNGKIKANTAKELMVILRYLFKVLSTNKSAVMTLVGGSSSTIGQIVSNVINCGADGITKIVVDILLKLQPFENATWTFKDIKSVVTKYTENYDRDDYAEAVGMTDDLITELLGELLNLSLTDLIEQNLYTNSIINTIAKLIYTNIEKVDIGIDINTVLKVIDLDVTTKGVSKQISDFSAASSAIAKCSTWADVDFDTLDWGVTTGDRTSFVNALAAVLRPFDSVLSAVLSGDDLVVLGSIQIAGGDAYNTALVPLAEALGVETTDLTSVATYKENSTNDTLITSLINPVLDKVEEIADAPITTLCNMLPNIAYFILNGGVKEAAENLLKPVTNILEEIDPIYSIDLDQYLSYLDNIDIDSLANSILSSVEINGTALGIQIPDIDLETLAGRGTIVDYTSVRTYNGSRMQCKMVEADTPAVFISVLRYLLETIKENLDAINALLASLNLGDSVTSIIDQILQALVDGDIDSVIELLMELLLGYGSDESPLEEAVAEDNTPSTTLVARTLGNYNWLYWLIWAVIVVVLVVVLLVVLKRGKKDDNPELDSGAAGEAPQGDKPNEN